MSQIYDRLYDYGGSRGFRCQEILVKKENIRKEQKNTPHYQCFSELFDGMKNNQSVPAILAPARKPMTYEKLVRQIEYVVLFLNSHGLGRDDRIGAVIPDGPEMAVVFLSTIACATFVPFAPHNRKDEYEFLMEKMRIKALFVHSGTETAAKSVAHVKNIPIIEVGQLAEEAGLFKLSCEGRIQGKTAKTGFAGPEETALVLNTSGTTSHPKIVPLTHTNIFSSAYHIADRLRLVSSDRGLHILPMVHIAGLISSIISPLTTGGSIICTPGFKIDTFFNWLTELRPTWYTAVPTVHQAVIEAAEKMLSNPADTSLRFIRTIASPIAETVIEKLEATFKVPVVQAYGMTEALSIACTPLEPYKRKPGSTGVPLCPEVAIQDEKGSLLKSGESGEIVVRGPHVVKGYENNPEANQKAYINGWFKTGDLGHFDDEGYLYITGRLKDIINRGGQKVSPQEVEAVLLSHPAVREACAFGAHHKRLGEAVVVAIVLKDSCQMSEREIRQYIAEKLIYYKVPQQVVFVDTLPKNSMGKVQRAGLSEKLVPLLQAEFSAPETEIEITVAKIWSEVLGLSHVGRYDNFFTLGGDSLLATQVVWRVKKEIGIDLPLLTVFQNTTLEGFVGAISQNLLNTVDEMELSELLAEIENLPEVEAKARLGTDVEN